MKKFQKFIFSRRVVGVFLTVCLCAPFAVCAQALSLPQDSGEFSAALALEALALCQGITAQDASQAVQEQGFTVLAQQHFDKAEDDPSHTCAFTLATAQLTYQQEPRTLLLVAIRGTSAGEWYANFDFEPSESSGGSFAGNFLFAAQDAFLSVQQALSQMENPLVLVCGYSRGAACANLLGLMLNAICPQENVFVYTFATPATVCGDASAYAAENIFNVVKEADIVTHVPLAQWGYSRAGTDIVLPSQQALVERAEDALATMGEIVPDIESYYKDRHSLTEAGLSEDGMTAFEMMLLVASSLAEADESMAVKETPVLESVAQESDFYPLALLLDKASEDPAVLQEHLPQGYLQELTALSAQE